MASKRDKRAKQKSTFKFFGAFLTSHMRRKFARKNRSKVLTDADALEAGFIDHHDKNSLSDSRSESKASGYITPSNSHSNKNGETVSLSDKISLSTGMNGSLAPPGVCGLVNHGATCYMNAIIQCLSNTDVLAEYFVMGQYRSDLKNAKKERSKKYGTNGELAEQLAVIIRALWTHQYKPSMTKNLKEIMCKYAPQYKGNEQHDSQEFLLWLFDKVHEDLNIQPIKKTFFLSRASMRKKRPKKNENGKLPVDQKEPQTQDTTPTSFIQKVFQAHYRSTLTCPSCQRQSHTTDPFLCLSLPITQRTTRPIYVNVSYLGNKRRSDSHRKGNCGKTIQIGIAAPIDGKILHLRQAVASECGIHSRLLTFSELSDEGFGASYGDDKLVSDLPSVASSASNLYAFEMPAPKKMSAGTLPRNFGGRHKKRPSLRNGNTQSKDAPSPGSNDPPTHQKIVIILVNKLCSGKDSMIFGRPFIFHISKEVHYSELQSLILLKIAQYKKHGVDEDTLASILHLRIVDGIPTKSYISPQARQPLLLPTVNKAIENCPAGGPLHIKLIAEWSVENKDDIFTETPQEPISEHDSVRLQRVLHQQPVTCSLQECFELLMKDEELGAEDAWNCPHCHKQRYGTLKKLSLYTLPDVLVVHLKRFRVVNDKRTKLNTRVDFPITGLDLGPHLIDQKKPILNGHGPRLNGIRQFAGLNSGSGDTLYDLYAVCNHFGNLNSGHYTAHCLNPLDGRWYLFDDKRTDYVAEDNLSSQSVYILFYQRRSVNPATSYNGGSVSSLMTSDHWAYSLPQYARQKASSQSHLNQYAVNAVNPQPFVETAPIVSQNSNNNNRMNGHREDVEKKITRRYSGSYVLHKKEKDNKMKKGIENGFHADYHQDPFVRGLPRQQSVPRTTGGSRRSHDVSSRRLSERGTKARPASQVEPFLDTYKKTTYF